MESSVGNLAGGAAGGGQGRAGAGAGRHVAASATRSCRRCRLSPKQGVPGYDVTGWYGLCTQSKVPQAIIAKINTDVNKLLAGPVLKKRLEDQGISITPSTPEAFLDYIKGEIDKWTRVVKEANLPNE